MKTALTIAGSDPTGGAGFQADLKVFRAFGVHGLSIPAALTAQNTVGIKEVLPVDGIFFEKQMDALLEDMRPDALKTGMLYKSGTIEIIAKKIREYSLKNLVIDPVTVSSSGTSLAEQGVLDSIREKLFPLSEVITPNIYEASVLAGMNIETDKDMEDAAFMLKEMGAKAVVITGGHLEQATVDLYYDGNEFRRIRSSKIPGEYHGTGCAFSAAIAASLALGHAPLESVKKAKDFVTKAIRDAGQPGKGMKLLNI